MKSFGILRTNPGLTTNIKVMVDSGYRLSLDSIDSAPELSASKFKKVEFNKDTLYDDLLPYFYDGLPAETAYEIKYDDDATTISYNFANQYDEIYQYGARNIINNKNYAEEYEYFAPLYIQKGKLPKYFAIFRVDGPGILKMDRLNFKDQIIKKLKTVNIFDMTKTTALGQWLEKNINDNEFYPNTPFEMNYDALEFSVWKGINFVSGGYVDRAQFLDDVLEEEKEIFEMEKFIFDGYKKNKVVFPNILNFSFLFDDTPADENRLRKWSMNRYYGFYVEDMDMIKTISPYSPPAIMTDAKVINGNILESVAGDPFVKGFRTDVPMYVEYDGEYYRVEKFTEKQLPTIGTTTNNTSNNKANTTKGPNVTISSGILTDTNNPVTQDYKKDEKVEIIVDRWRIIADIDLSGKEGMLNGNTGKITNNKLLVDSEGMPITIEDFERSDIWLIEINGKYHNLVASTDGIMISSDHSFEFSDNSYSYFVNKNDPAYTTIISTLVDFNNPPKKFTIYRAKLSSVKDFDTRIVDTEPSKFEYERRDEVTKTEESKLYFTDLNSDTIPKRIDVFKYKDVIVNIPVSSEYTANQETFKIDGVNLSPIWRKNPVYCRWAYNGSISANDYPYTLNNSRAFEDFNRTTNPYDATPKRSERNLDYFYTINSSSYEYVHHSLHVEKNSEFSTDKSFDFDFDKYLGTKKLLSTDGSTTTVDFDYFNHFFTIKSSFERNAVQRNTKKYSEFITGDSETPNYTVFRGIKFAMYDVVDGGVKFNSAGQISDINTTLNNTFEDYKFSVLLTSKDNGMRWDIIEKWNAYRDFKAGDIVVHDDILYQARFNTIYNSHNVSMTRTIKSGNLLNDFEEKSMPAPYNLLAYGNGLISPTVLLNHSLQYDNKINNDWIFYSETKDTYIGEVFWQPLRSLAVDSKDTPKPYARFDVVYRHGTYYYLENTNGIIDFWNPAVALKVTTDSFGSPLRAGYKYDSTVYHNGKFYNSTIDGNIKRPDETSDWVALDEELSPYLKWKKVEIWKSNKQYGSTYSLVVHNNVVYRGTNETDIILSGTTPGKSTQWIRIYSLEADTDFVYKANLNPYILHNEDVYRTVTNPGSKTLENGVRIFINHKHKNVLVNIFVNDNTLEKLRDSDRDTLYNRSYTKLVAKNFIDHINGITRKNGFSDHLSYVVVSATGSVSTYGFGNNLSELKHILFAYGPEKFSTNHNSLRFDAINEIRLTPTKELQAGKITDISQINYFNNTHLATDIVQSDDTAVVSIPGSANTLYRFSGSYVPLFYEIELFNKDNSIDTNKIDVMLEISDAQYVTFDFMKDGSGSQSNYQIYPGSSYSTATAYWQQVIDIVGSRFPSVDFSYEILPKPKQPIGTEYVSFDQNSYNPNLDTWFDSGKSGAYANPVPSNAMPTLVKTDLYPGDNFVFKGTSGILSFMRTNTIIPPNESMSYEFVVKSDQVQNFSAYMGNGSTIFGFHKGRAFAKVDLIYGNVVLPGQSMPYGNEVAVYSTNILQANTWYHLVFNFKVTKLGFLRQTEMSVFVDGVDRTEKSSIGLPSFRYPSQTSLTNAWPVRSSNVFAIGTFKDFSFQTGPFSDNFSGNIASIRIHNRDLTKSEIENSFVGEHQPLSIKYKSSEGEITMNLLPQYPTLTINLIDTFDPLYPYFAVQMGATGGNPPYSYSFDGGAFSENSVYTGVAKNGNYKVIVNDVLGLSASTGYYLINSVIESPTKITNGIIAY